MKAHETMTDPAKTILILEDRPALRQYLCDVFEDRGFRTFGAGTTLEAREIFDRHPEDFDVLILDMHLREPQTGAEFGLEVRDRLRDWPPEFLIHSGYDETKYYQLAFRLGAAAYLRKADQPPESVIRHVRALALRRGLRADRPDLETKIQKIVEGSRSQARAMDRFCERVLAPELARTLGGQFLLLIADEEGPRCFDSHLQEFPRSEGLKLLQHAVSGGLASGKSWVLETEDDLPEGFGPDDSLRLFLTSHLGTTFIHLAELEDFSLALGVVQESQEEVPLAEDASELAPVIARYLQPAVTKPLAKITRRWAEAETRKRTLISFAARAFGHVGREIDALLDEVIASGTIAAPAEGPLNRLRTLGRELEYGGQNLGYLGLPDRDRPGEPEPIEVATLIREVWQNLVKDGKVRRPEFLELADLDLVVEARKDYVSMALQRVLLWFAARALEAPADQRLRVHAGSAAERAVCFEDRSRRLTRKLRQRQFEPFAATFVEPVAGSEDLGRRFGLFFARALVEAEGGSLADRTDELEEEEIGHRLVMRFPAAA